MGSIIKFEKSASSGKDIKLAIQKEQECLNRLENNDNDADIDTYLADAGYSNFEDYQKDKSLYMLKNTEFEFHEETQITSTVALPYIVKRKPAFLWMTQNSGNYAFVPSNFNRYEKLKRHNIIPVNMGYMSNGIILTSNGDLRIVIIFDDVIDIHTDYFLNKCCDFLRHYYPSAIVDKNDILINGKKVAGSVEILKSHMRCLMFQITYCCDTELIREVCGKNAKIPGHINSSIVSPEKLKDEFIKCLL